MPGNDRNFRLIIIVTIVRYSSVLKRDSSRLQVTKKLENFSWLLLLRADTRILSLTHSMTSRSSVHRGDGSTEVEAEY